MPMIDPVTVGVIGLVAKAIVDVSRDVLKGHQDKVKARNIQTELGIEEAKALQVSLAKDGRPGIIAFCPAHIDHVQRITTLESEARHINEDLEEIKGDVKVIRVAVGK